MYEFHTAAEEPSRSSGKMTIGWGMVSIPVSLYTGTEETRGYRKEFVEGDPTRPVGRLFTDKTTGDPIDYASITKMAEKSDGSFVPLTDDEIDSLSMPKGLAEIISFVKIKEAGRYLPKNLVQVRPPAEKGKVDFASAKAFSLLLAALHQTASYALLRYSSRGTVKHGLLTENGDLVEVFTCDAIRSPRNMNTLPVVDSELALAVSLVENMGFEAPVVIDQTSVQIRTYVDAKTSSNPTPALAPPTAPDILQNALEASIAAIKAQQNEIA